MIETEHLILRTPTLDDAEPLMAVFGDAAVMRYISNGETRSIEQVRSSIEKKLACLNEYGACVWTIELRTPLEDGTVVVGDCGLLPVAWKGPEFEIAYRLAPAAWGRGVASEAASAAIEHGWRSTNLDRIIGLTYSDNVASRRVLSKVGMTHLGQSDRYYDKVLELFQLERPIG